MSARPPSARLSFANEVVDDIFGHLVESAPPTDPQSESKKSLALEALIAVSLVSKQWRDVALRRMVTKVVVRTSSRAREVTKFLAVGGLGKCVSDLKFEGGGGGSFRLKTTPTSSEAAKHDWLTSADVVALLQITTRLQILKILRAPFIRFRQRERKAISTLPLITTLKTVSFASASLDVHQELMASLIPIFTGVKSLNISPAHGGKSARTPAIPSTLASLDSVHLAGTTSIETFLSLVDTRNLGSLVDLFVVQPNVADLDRLLVQVGPRLKAFGCSVVTPLATYFPAVLARCPGLTLLDFYFLWTVVDAVGLLLSIPSTVHTLRLTPCDEVDNVGNLLAALKLIPRPPHLSHLEILKDRFGAEVSGGLALALEAHGLRVTYAD